MEEILIEDYNYPLPDERIAKYPLAMRDQSKLLIYRDGKVNEDTFCHVGEYLNADSLLIYNNTRVIQARLEFHKQAEDGTQGARIEIFCLEPQLPSDYQLALGTTESCTWKCMIGNAKKWKSGILSLPVTLAAGEEITLIAEKGVQTGNTFAVHFSWNFSAKRPNSGDYLNFSFAEILDAVGELPIPPYLNRKTEESDKTTYQTVYSRIKGSVAAPTAGLHFTDSVFECIDGKNIHRDNVCLHVGAGTFVPVKSEFISDHVMPGDEVGVDLLRYVDTDVRFSKTRKILLTGQAGHADTIRAINEAHIDNYFDKPWKADELLLAAKKLLTQFILDCGLEYEDYMSILDQEVLLSHLKRG